MWNALLQWESCSPMRRFNGLLQMLKELPENKPKQNPSKYNDKNFGP